MVAYKRNTWLFFSPEKKRTPQKRVKESKALLRIAQCTDSFLPITDGVGRAVYEYSCALSARGHECYVVTPAADAGFRGRYPFEIVDYLSLKMPGKRALRYGVAELDMHYVARMDRVPLDIVHAHSPGSAGLEAARLAERLRIPLIGTFHPSCFENLSRSISYESLAAAALKRTADFFTRCDEVWTVSGQAGDMLREAGYNGRVEVMPSGSNAPALSDAELARCRDIFHLTQAPILLYVGRIDMDRSVARILRTAAMLRAAGKRFQMLFVGQGPDEQAARDYIRELSMQGVARFLGTVSDERMLCCLYATADLLLYPAPLMASGLVVQEAAAMGTPALVVRGSAPAEGVRDGENGLCVEDSAPAMAAAIARALSNPGALRAMGERARVTLPHAWAEVTEGVEARYLELTEREKYSLKRKSGILRWGLASVDETMEKRFADLVGRYLRQDMQHIYAYPNRETRPKRPLAKRDASLPRATPESQGISSAALEGLFTMLDVDAQAQPHGMLVVKNGCVVAEACWEPYQAELPHQLYSLSKSVTATAVGMLVDENGLDLDERLCAIFPERAPENPLHPAHKLTVRQLLDMSTGSAFNEVGSALGSDWVREFLTESTLFEPGTAFSYNSMNSYMLAAVVRKKTGQTLTDYLRPRLFEPLGIARAPWETCPKGTEKGGWGLSLTLESVAKIGMLYLNGGVWDGEDGKKRLLSEEWVREATRPQIKTPKGEITYGYGYQIWMTKRPGAFLFNGAFGQYMLAMPEHNAAVTLFSGTARLFAQGGVMDYIDAAFAGAQPEPLPENPEALSHLRAFLARLSCKGRVPFYEAGVVSAPFSALVELIDGRVYTFERNIGGLFPANLQTICNNFTEGLEHIVFRKTEDGALSVTFDEKRNRNTLALRPDAYTTGAVTLREDTQRVAVRLQCSSENTGEWTLRLSVHFLETPFTKLIRLCIRDDSITAIFDESPSVQDASAMLLNLTGISRMQLVRAVMPIVRRDSLQQRLRGYTTVTAQGRL